MLASGQQQDGAKWRGACRVKAYTGSAAARDEWAHARMGGWGGGRRVSA